MKTKAQKIMELLNNNPALTNLQVANKVNCAMGYVYAIRKKMAHVEPCPEHVLELTPEMEVKPGEFIETGSVNAVLNQRAKNYGTFYDLASLAQGLKNVLMAHLQQQNKQLVVDQQEALEFILSKIARIANGNHNYVDNWVDIAGYAQLVAERLQAEER